jgi:ABC-type branched-subunit amino acid transport system ATPase component
MTTQEPITDEEGEDVRARTRAAFGLDADTVPWLGEALRQGAGPYPLLAVALLAFAAAAPAAGLLVLRVDIAASLGVGPGAPVARIGLQIALAGAVMAGLAWWNHRSLRRGALSLAAGWLGSAALLLAAFAPRTEPLLLLALGGGIALGAAWSLHAPLLADAYPLTARTRALAWHWGAFLAGAGAASGLAAVLAAPGALSWRGALIGLSASSAICCVVASRVRDPGVGRFDDAPARAVATGSPLEPSAPGAPPTDLRFFEAVRRASAVPTLKAAAGALSALGMFAVPAIILLHGRIDSGWRVAPPGRGLALAAVLAVALPAALWVAGISDARLARGDERPMRPVALVLAASATLLGIGAVLPWSAAGLPLVAVGMAGAAAAHPPIVCAAMSAVPAAVRTHAGLLLGLASSLGGGIAALLVLASVAGRYGPGVALAVLTPIGWMVARSVSRLGDGIADDLDRRIDDVLPLGTGSDRAGSSALLSCHGIDFAYGQVQVLFDVDFSVSEGEMVALLGTNGAGKSTLLRVISGLGMPTRGQVRYRAEDITYLDAERRLPLGIAQIPGGKAVFGPLTVVENLRVFGFALARDSKAIDRGIEATFEAFPRLAERRNQLASTLSGGEQQMLALGKAFLLRPKLLLIDELSLGLAPKIVGELLDMVRRVNAAGTAIVLVEQSVNIALSLVEHAYFMERGQVRFDGPAAELLDQRDLLRSVFLEGAAAGLPEGEQETAVH